ncbi:putative Bgh-specific protein [Blumeria hordei DH14]|uniref:Putative Bgh-specific protein n=1 Tax=Blumeria graminis f. sp. hordei (strain DH14) TaxID=546991 RepID=N1J9J4_BLUG1|nr:putative Bgh-specific protein [Blumeria hordei DH14]
MIPFHTARALRHGEIGNSALSPDFALCLALSTRAYHEATGPSTPAPCSSLRLRVEPRVIATNRPGQGVLAPFARARRDGDGRIFVPAMMRLDLFHRTEKSPARPLESTQRCRLRRLCPIPPASSPYSSIERLPQAIAPHAYADFALPYVDARYSSRSDSFFIQHLTEIEAALLIQSAQGALAASPIYGLFARDQKAADGIRLPSLASVANIGALGPSSPRLRSAKSSRRENSRARKSRVKASGHAQQLSPCVEWAYAGIYKLQRHQSQAPIPGKKLVPNLSATSSHCTPNSSVLYIPKLLIILSSGCLVQNFSCSVYLSVSHGASVASFIAEWIAIIIPRILLNISASLGKEID